MHCKLPDLDDSTWDETHRKDDRRAQEVQQCHGSHTCGRLANFSAGNGQGMVPRCTPGAGAASCACARSPARNCSWRQGQQCCCSGCWCSNTIKLRCPGQASMAAAAGAGEGAASALPSPCACSCVARAPAAGCSTASACSCGSATLQHYISRQVAAAASAGAPAAARLSFSSLRQRPTAATPRRGTVSLSCTPRRSQGSNARGASHKATPQHPASAPPRPRRPRTGASLPPAPRPGRAGAAAGGARPRPASGSNRQAKAPRALPVNLQVAIKGTQAAGRAASAGPSPAASGARQGAGGRGVTPSKSPCWKPPGCGMAAACMSSTPGPALPRPWDGGPSPARRNTVLSHSHARPIYSSRMGARDGVGCSAGEGEGSNCTGGRQSSGGGGAGTCSRHRAAARRLFDPAPGPLEAGARAAAQGTRPDEPSELHVGGLGGNTAAGSGVNDTRCPHCNCALQQQQQEQKASAAAGRCAQPGTCTGLPGACHAETQTELAYRTYASHHVAAAQPLGVLGTGGSSAPATLPAANGSGTSGPYSHHHKHHQQQQHSAAPVAKQGAAVRQSGAEQRDSGVSCSVSLAFTRHSPPGCQRPAMPSAMPPAACTSQPPRPTPTAAAAAAAAVGAYAARSPAAWSSGAAPYVSARAEGHCRQYQQQQQQQQPHSGQSKQVTETLNPKPGLLPPTSGRSAKTAAMAPSGGYGASGRGGGGSGSSTDNAARCSVDSADTLAELEALIEEQHRELVERGILPAADDEGEDGDLLGAFTWPGPPLHALGNAPLHGTGGSGGGGGVGRGLRTAAAAAAGFASGAGNRGAGAALQGDSCTRSGKSTISNRLTGDSNGSGGSGSGSGIRWTDSSGAGGRGDGSHLTGKEFEDCMSEDLRSTDPSIHWTNSSGSGNRGGGSQLADEDLGDCMWEGLRSTDPSTRWTDSSGGRGRGSGSGSQLTDKDLDCVGEDLRSTNPSVRLTDSSGGRGSGRDGGSQLAGEGLGQSVGEGLRSTNPSVRWTDSTGSGGGRGGGGGDGGGGGGLLWPQGSDASSWDCDAEGGGAGGLDSWHTSSSSGGADALSNRPPFMAGSKHASCDGSGASEQAPLTWQLEAGSAQRGYSTGVARGSSQIGKHTLDGVKQPPFPLEASPSFLAGYLSSMGLRPQQQPYQPQHAASAATSTSSAGDGGRNAELPTASH